MAIQEFIIGPQNYFEPGYFDGDYTEPNVSKSFLECDIDNIKGGRVITGVYYLGDYIDGTYYHDNSIRATLACDAIIVQVATVSLTGYYEYGYHESGYYRESGSVFTLTAELTPFGEDVFGSGTLASTATMSVAVGKITLAASAMSAAFTQTAVGARDRDIDLFAFSNASIAVQVGVIKQNNIAVSSVFSVATDGRRFRDLASAEQSLFDLSVINTRSRASSMNAQAAFSLSASAVATLSIISTLSSNFSLSINGGIPKSTSANLISFSGIQTSRYLGTGRPHPTSYINPSAYYDASDKQEGTHSIVLSGVGTIYESEPSNAFTINANENFDISFYLKLDHIPTNERAVARYGSDDYAWLITANNVGIQSLKFYFRNAAGTVLSLNAVDIQSRIGQWMLVRAFRSGTSLGFTVNGSGVSSNFANAFREPASFADRKISIFGVDNTTGGGTKLTKFDFLQYNIASTDIIVLPFNNNSNDSLEVITHEGAAAITSTASVTAQANGNTKSAGAAITSTATLSINAGKLKTGQASLDVTSTQQTTVVKTVTISSNITSAVTIIATGERIKQFTSNQNALFTPSIVCQAQLAGVALLESQFAQTVQPVKTARTTSTISSQFAITASTTLSAGLSSDTTIVSSVNATATRIQSANIALASAGTLTCDFAAINNVSASLSTTAALSVNIDHFVGYASNMTSAVTMISDLRRVRLTSSTQSTAVSVIVTATRIQNAQSALTATSTQSTAAVKTASISSSISTASTQTATPVKTVNAIPQLTGIATQLTLAFKNATGTVTLESAFSFSASIGIIKRLDSVFSLASTGVQIYGGTTGASLGPQGNGIFTQDLVLDRNATISFWARRNLNSYLNVPQTLFGTVAEGPNNTRLVFDYFYNNATSQYNNVIRWDYYQGGGAASWVFDTAIDDEWHHFLLRMNNNASGGTAFRYWDLWVDGVYISEQQNNTLNNTPRISSQYLSLGYQIPFGVDPDISVFDGSLAQLWIGNTNSASNYIFNNNDFYLNGVVDLGPDGRAVGYLPAPQIFNNLNDPFTAVNFVNYGVLQKTAPEPLVYTGMVGRFALAATPVSVLVFTANLTSNVTVSANTVKQVDAQSTLNSTATLSCQITQFTGIIANVNSTATMVTNITKITPGAATLAVTVTVQVVAGFFENFSGAFAISAALECDFDNIPPTRGEAALTATFTVSADVASFTDAITMMMSAGTITCDATLIPPIRIEANLTTTTTLTATIGSIEQFAALTASAGTMIVLVGKSTGIILTVTAQSQLTATVKHYKGIILNLSAFNTVLTTGEVINIDPYLTLTITAETRGLRILPENREISIESETRVNII